MGSLHKHGPICCCEDAILFYKDLQRLLDGLVLGCTAFLNVQILAWLCPETIDHIAILSCSMAGILIADKDPVYSPPSVDRIWLWVCYNKIPIYPRFYPLKEDSSPRP